MSRSREQTLPPSQRYFFETSLWNILNMLYRAYCLIAGKNKGSRNVWERNNYLWNVLYKYVKRVVHYRFFTNQLSRKIFIYVIRIGLETRLFHDNYIRFEYFDKHHVLLRLLINIISWVYFFLFAIRVHLNDLNISSHLTKIIPSFWNFFSRNVKNRRI